MRITNEQNSATTVTINLKVSMCRDIIANSNVTKAYVVNPCDSCNTDNTPLNAIHVHYTQYSSTVLWYIPIKTIYKVFHHFHFQFAAYWISVNINM